MAQKNSVMLMWWIVVLTTLIPLLNYLRGKAEGGLLDRAGTGLDFSSPYWQRDLINGHWWV